MYRSSIKTPILLPPVVTQATDQVKSILLVADKQTQIISIMAEYIKGEALRTDTYTALEKLKKSIT
jgi:hypothetical protein